MYKSLAWIGVYALFAAIERPMAANAAWSSRVMSPGTFVRV